MDFRSNSIVTFHTGLAPFACNTQRATIVVQYIGTVQSPVINAAVLFHAYIGNNTWSAVITFFALPSVLYYYSFIFQKSNHIT